MKEACVNLVLVSTFLLYLGLVNAELCISFKCNPKSEQNVTLAGLFMLCPNEKVEVPCTPCVDCSKLYQCDAKIRDVVYIDELKLFCLDGFNCNREYTMPCDSCVRKRCKNPRKFKCVSDKHVFVDDILVTCKSGFACNRDYLHPCYPCIGDTDFSFSKIVRFK
ncbi:PREDICTED: uncharacterized protein LOC108567917 [Nicrophorus vespilloides]|uniref:Uncharacterized protein LOC108567917 n=1 Tax=Nicrophorus vespilloides TaxID=110193 RepID=A0ABM1NBJ4_NICVS|nr:PREDICTED: uncharacterized protein LOC108567917 [Nicrophorus vespilloides]